VIPAHGLRILAPAAQPRWFAHSAFDSMQFHVPVDALRDMADGRARSSRIELKDPLYASEPGVTPLVHAVASALERRDQLTASYVDGLAIALLSRLVSRFSKPGFDCRRRAVTLDARLRRAIDFINTHLADDLRLATISAVAGVSPYHFSHLFTAAMGMPPHRYLLKQRNPFTCLEWAHPRSAQSWFPRASRARKGSSRQVRSRRLATRPGPTMKA